MSKHRRSGGAAGREYEPVAEYTMGVLSYSYEFGDESVTDILIAWFLFAALGAAMLWMNRILGPRKTNPLKEQPFECGSPPLQEGIHPFPVKYDLAAFVFLLFDVEIVFFIPWALVFHETESSALAVIAVYILILAVGFSYAWKKGAFDWK